MSEAAVVLFDGLCNVCNGWVRFVMARDPEGRFHFAALQSDVASRLLRQFQTDVPVPDSLLLVEGGRLYTRSAAVLRVVRHLAAPWPIAYGLVAVPRPIRDWVYDLVARRRYRWFGRRDVCMVPTPEQRSRFLE